MAYECCPTCLGIGSYLRSEWTRNEEFIYKKITVRRACDACGGTGRALASGGMRTLYCSTLDTGRFAAKGQMRRVDRVAYSYLAVLALPGYILYQIFSEAQGDAWRIKVSAACLAFAVLVLILTKLPKSGKVSRGVAVLLLLAGVFGGLAFEFMRH